MKPKNWLQQQKNTMPNKHKYLIIGGAGKSGTTSLFYYLSQHPKIIPSRIKEPGFFADEDFPYQGPCPLSKGPTCYYSLFSPTPIDTFRMEASTQYLHSLGSAKRIFDFLGQNAWFLFTLRHPVDYLFSLFKYGKQLGNIPSNTNFDDFVTKQFDAINCPNAKLNMIALSMGCFSNYLKIYYDIFNHDHIQIVFFEEIKTDPTKILMEICNFLNISPECTRSFDYRVHNKTMTIRNQKASQLYYAVHRNINKWTFDKPVLHNIFKRIKDHIEPVKSLILETKNNPGDIDTISKKTNDKLMNYYAPELEQLSSLTGRQIPWEFEIHSSR